MLTEPLLEEGARRKCARDKAVVFFLFVFLGWHFAVWIRLEQHLPADAPVILIATAGAEMICPSRKILFDRAIDVSSHHDVQTVINHKTNLDEATLGKHVQCALTVTSGLQTRTNVIRGHLGAFTALPLQRQPFFVARSRLTTPKRLTEPGTWPWHRTARDITYGKCLPQHCWPCGLEVAHA